MGTFLVVGSVLFTKFVLAHIYLYVHDIQCSASLLHLSKLAYSGVNIMENAVLRQ